jgi:hypothetical protein
MAKGSGRKRVEKVVVPRPAKEEENEFEQEKALKALKLLTARGTVNKMGQKKRKQVDKVVESSSEDDDSDEELEAEMRALAESQIESQENGEEGQEGGKQRINDEVKSLLYSCAIADRLLPFSTFSLRFSSL